MSSRVERTEFGPEDVKKFRKQHDLSVEDLATLMGVTKQAVIFWEGEGSAGRKVSEPVIRMLLLFKKHPHLMNEF